MFDLKGKLLTSRYYARNIPALSLVRYEMSYVEESSFFYKTIPFPTRLINLQNDFKEDYTKRLQTYFRKMASLNLETHRPDCIPDLESFYQPVIENKGLNPLPDEAFKIDTNYHYSSIHHPKLGRLAAHLNIGDPEELRVFGYINASAFRSFEKKIDRQICSAANKYLYHQDMEYFKSKGYRYFDLVGTHEPMNQMKKQFGGEIAMTYTHIPYPIYWLKKVKALTQTVI